MLTGEWFEGEYKDGERHGLFRLKKKKNLIFQIHSFYIFITILDFLAQHRFFNINESLTTLPLPLQSLKYVRNFKISALYIILHFFLVFLIFSFAYFLTKTEKVEYTG